MPLRAVSLVALVVPTLDAELGTAPIARPHVDRQAELARIGNGLPIGRDFLMAVLAVCRSSLLCLGLLGGKRLERLPLLAGIEVLASPALVAHHVLFGLDAMLSSGTDTPLKHVVSRSRLDRWILRDPRRLRRWMRRLLGLDESHWHLASYDTPEEVGLKGRLIALVLDWTGRAVGMDE